MSRRRVLDLEVAGTSLLDVLCCGLGAVILLVVLSGSISSQTLDRAVLDLEQQRESTDRSTAAASRLDAVGAQLASQAAVLPPPAGRVQDQAASGLQVFPHASASSVLVLLDTSGSMAIDHPDDLPLLQEAPKWKRVVGVLENLLMGMPGLERLAVLSISDNTDGRCGAPLISGISGRWLELNRHEERPAAERIAVVVEELAAIQPSGGSAHYYAFEVALRYLSRGTDGSPAADAVFVVTDGLPNHGPELMGDGQLGGEVHPAGLVLPESKIRRQAAATRLLNSRLSDLQRTRTDAQEVQIHVVCVPWPDDLELPQFASDLTRPTGGLVLFLPSVDERP